MIARLLGYTDQGVSKALRRDPISPPVKFVIVAWENMTPIERRTVRRALGA